MGGRAMTVEQKRMTHSEAGRLGAARRWKKEAV